MRLKPRKQLTYVPNFLFFSGQVPNLFPIYPPNIQAKQITLLHTTLFTIGLIFSAVCIHMLAFAIRSCELKCENANLWVIVHCFPPSRFKLTHLFSSRLAYVCLANNGCALLLESLHFQIHSYVCCVLPTHMYVVCVECMQVTLKEFIMCNYNKCSFIR